MESAVRAATHGDDLVLVDPKGVQTRLVRQPPPAADSLVGTWTVEGAPEQGVVLDLHDGGFGLTSFCGNEAGRVLVSGADLVLAPQPSEQGCNPAWVRVAVSVRADGADRVLLDASGAQVARLVPTTSTRTIEFPMLAERALPDGLTAEARADLLGAWTLGDDVLRFTADGAWTSRSCSGYWNVGGAGLVVFGEVTGCLVPDPLVAARRVGTHDTELVLVASDGTQTVLTRA